jgi:hypothetical protein
MSRTDDDRRRAREYSRSAKPRAARAAKYAQLKADPERYRALIEANRARRQARQAARQLEAATPAQINHTGPFAALFGAQG